MDKPVFRSAGHDRESHLEYIARLLDWQEWQHQQALLETAAIDKFYNGNKAKRIVTESVVTAQRKMNRTTIHEHAESNPILRYILKGEK